MERLNIPNKKSTGANKAQAQIPELLQQGIALWQKWQLKEAQTIFDRVLALQPKNFEALQLSAIIAGQSNNFQLALKMLDEILSIKPDFADAHSNRGLAFKGLNRFNEAIASFDRAIELNPKHFQAHLNRGLILKELNKIVDAIESYEHAIAIKPDYAEALNSRGIALKELNQFEDAIASYKSAIAINPEYAEAHSNLGAALSDLKQFNKAIESYNKAIEINPNSVQAQFNKSLAMLLKGEFKQGWEIYEWRNKIKKKELRNFTQSRWLVDEDITNKTILLHAEQGLGDTIQFCRYAKLVKARGARVLLEAPKALMGLLKTLGGVDDLVEKGTQLPSFDYHCPLLSLPLAFKTELDTIPSAKSYLYVDKNKRKEWNKNLGEVPKLRVGLVWSGSLGHINDHNRSLTLQELLPYLPKDYEYVSLQKEVREGDKDVLATSGIKHFGEQLNDFTDTAALCELMDIVISVDTSVAHLAGALGKKTWIMLPYSPDWRWLLDRDDSPWYPSVKLYRQDKIGDWISVLEKMKSDLINHK